MKNDHITKLDKCTSDFFIAPIVITAKKDGSIKLAMDAKPINSQIHKNKYQMPIVDELLDCVSQIIAKAGENDEVWFTSLDLNYAFSQLPLSEQTSKHCNFSVVGGKATGTYRFKTGFYGLTDMPTEFQKAMDATLLNLLNTFCFLDDVLIVSVGSITDHNKLVEEAMKRIEAEGFSLKAKKCEFSVHEIDWLGYTISKSGVKPMHSKTEDILNLKPPNTLKKLRSFIGSINSVSKFLPKSQELVAVFKPRPKITN